MGKYGNKRVEADGYKFDSIAERDRYYQLKLMQQAGGISGLRVHPTYTLQEKFKDRTGKWQRAIAYEADFEYTHEGELVAEDVKGHSTEVFKLKKKLFLAKYPTIDLRIVSVSYRG